MGMVELVGLDEAEGAASRAGVAQWCRTRVFEVAILLWSLPFALAILTVFQVHRPPRLVRWALRRWSLGFVAAARVIVGVRYEIEGRENIPAGPAIYVCNHQSYWESIALTGLIPDVNVISKAESARIPVFGWGLSHAPMTFVHRDRPGTNIRRVIRESRKYLKEGRSALLFPEGTRVAPGGRKPYRRGLEALYRWTGASIVPVVHNAGLCWTKGFAVKHAGSVTLRFLPPIAPGAPPGTVARDLEALINVEKDRLLHGAGAARDPDVADRTPEPNYGG